MDFIFLSPIFLSSFVCFVVELRPSSLKQEVTWLEIALFMRESRLTR